MENTPSTTNKIAAQVLVLHCAIASMAAAAENKSVVLAYFERLSEQLIADLLTKPASEEFLRSVQSHIQDFRGLLSQTTLPRNAK